MNQAMMNHKFVTLRPATTLMPHPKIRKHSQQGKRRKIREMTQNKSMQLNNIKELLKHYPIDGAPKVGSQNRNNSQLTEHQRRVNVSQILAENETDTLKLYLQERNVIMKQIKNVERQKSQMKVLRNRKSQDQPSFLNRTIMESPRTKILKKLGARQLNIKKLF